MTSRARPAATAVAVVVAGAVWLAALGVWAYASYISNVHPGRLPRPLVASIHLRTDTSGALAFAVSVGAFLVLQRLATHRRRRDRVILARTLLLYGVLAALYVGAHALTEPWLLPLQLTHLAPWPTEGEFGLLGLVAAAAGLAMLVSGTGGGAFGRSGPRRQ